MLKAIFLFSLLTASWMSTPISAEEESYDPSELVDFLKNFQSIDAEEMEDRLVFALQNGKEEMIRILQNLPRNDELVDQPIDFAAKGNAIYSGIAAYITKLLHSNLPAAKEINIGNETTPLEVTEGRIIDLNLAEFILESVGNGFNVGRLAFRFPNITLAASNYVMRDFPIGDPALITLSGEGPLKISIYDLQIFLAYDCKYSSVRKEFTVGTVRSLGVSLVEAKFELTNLGGSGAAISELLNGIATDMVEVIVRMASTALGSLLWKEDGVTPSDFNDILGTAVIQYLMNEALKVAQLDGIENSEANNAIQSGFGALWLTSNLPRIATENKVAILEMVNEGLAQLGGD